MATEVVDNDVSSPGSPLPRPPPTAGRDSPVPSSPSRNRHGSGEYEDCQTHADLVAASERAGEPTNSLKTFPGLRHIFARSASAPSIRGRAKNVLDMTTAATKSDRGLRRISNAKPPDGSLTAAAIKQKIEQPFQQLHGLLQKWRNDTRHGVDPAGHAHRKELSEVLEVQVKMGHISHAEMMEILTKDNRAAADKEFNSQLEGEAEFVYVCEKIGYYVRKHFCAGGDGRPAVSNNAENNESAELPLDDLATIKIVRGAGADEIEVPKVCTHLGVVVYKGRKGLVQEDNTIEEMDEKEAVFVEQYRSGGIDMNDLQAIMAKHKKFLALSQSDTLERRSHENVAKWMNYIDNGDSVDANDDDDDGLPPRIGRSVSPNSPPDARAPSAGKPQNPDNGAQPTPIPNPFLLLQRKIKQKNQSLSHIRKSHSCSRWRKRGQAVPSVAIAVYGGAFEIKDPFKDGDPKVQQRMLAFLKDLAKKRLGIAVFFLYPNATQEQKREAEKLLFKNGFKGLYSGTILTNREDGGDSDPSPGKVFSPRDLRRFLESKLFHVVANMAMEKEWFIGGNTDMHVLLKEEIEQGIGFQRRRPRSLSYSSQSSEDDLGLPDLSDGSSDDNELGLPPLEDLIGDSSGSGDSDNDLGIPPLDELLGDDKQETEHFGRRRGRS